MGSPKNITENSRIFGDESKLKVVRSTEIDDREWLGDAPVCAALAKHNILHAAVMHAKEGFSVSRAHQSGTFMLASLEGEGMVLADGRWKKVKAGQACLLPPFVANSLKVVDGQDWKFCWVRYIESKACKPIVSEISPVSGDFHGEPLASSILGLIAECQTEHAPAAEHLWVELIQHYVLSFAQPHQKDDRLWKLWNRVEKHLDKDWSLHGLAHDANLSEEHLRRLCKKQLGRSPMQHLTFLRMQRASHLLSSTSDKVEVVAKTVGYASAFHFSNVFAKWVGCRPSEHR
jgi:AraC-like DNA-binding protein